MMLEAFAKHKDSLIIILVIGVGFLALDIFTGSERPWLPFVGIITGAIVARYRIKR